MNAQNRERAMLGMSAIRAAQAPVMPGNFEDRLDALTDALTNMRHAADLMGLDGQDAFGTAVGRSWHHWYQERVTP